MKKYLIILPAIILASCLKTNTDSNEKTSNTVKIVQEDKHKLEAFEDFFIEFSKDSVFQLKHIKEPMKYSYYEDVMSEKLTDSIMDEYTFIDFSKDRLAINNDINKFTVSITKSNGSVQYERKGYDNGILEIYNFESNNNCWLLSSIIDKSN